MKVIEPVTFNISQLLSTNAVDAYADYNAATSYSKGDRVHYSDAYWESLVNTNVGNTPSTSPSSWLNIGPCNIVAMFDNSISTETSSPTPLTFSIKPGQIINSIAVLGITGTSLNIQVLDSVGGTEVYNKTFSLDGTIITDWYAYFFEPYDIRDTVVITDIPPYANCVINVTLTGDSTVSIGNFIYGNYTDIGSVQYGVGFGIRDYSVKETDDFGNTVFVKRAYSKRMEPSLMLDNTRLNYVARRLNNLRATPTVWVGSDEASYEALVVFGYYRDYDITISYPTSSLIRLSIEGLT